MAGKAGATVLAIGGVSGWVVTWVRLGNLPLDARWVISAIVTIALLGGAALILRDLAKGWSRATMRFAAITVALIVAMIGFALINLSTRYHSLLIRHDSCVASVAGWKCIEYRPPRDPINADLRMSLRGRTGTSVKWAPGLWSRASGTTWILQGENESELSVRLTGFRAPDRFGVAYRALPFEDAVTEQISGLDPESVSVIRDAQMGTFRVWFFAYGGVLWLIGSVFLRYFWS